jgi:hypothetical protein
MAAEGYGSTPTPVSKLSGPEPGGGRTAVIHNEKRKTVYILCSIPLNLPIDELVTWKQLTGDRRLSDALAECDAKGWNALSLARLLRQADAADHQCPKGVKGGDRPSAGMLQALPQ